VVRLAATAADPVAACDHLDVSYQATAAGGVGWVTPL
jgi:hypothetical protein